MATAPADNFASLRRTAALLTAGKRLPADVHRWLTDALSALLAGADPHDVFGLRGEPSRRRPATAARYEQRNRALARAYALATGSTLDRGEAVLAWWSEHCAGRPLRSEVQAALSDVEATGLAPPSDAGSVARIAARATALMP